MSFSQLFSSSDGASSTLCTVEGAVHSQVNIFQPSDDEMPRSNLSDIENCAMEEPAEHRRGLCLTWRHPPSPLQGDVQAAAHLVEGLARRFGPGCSGRSLAQGHSPAKVVPNQRFSDLGCCRDR